jgi:hypothetical protein
VHLAKAVTRADRGARGQLAASGRDRALPLLGLGWMLEEGATLADRLGLPPDDAPERPGTEEGRRIKALIEQLGAEKAA